MRLQPTLPPAPGELRDPSGGYLAGRVVVAAVALALVLLPVILGVVAARDMRRRGESPLVWGLVVALLPLLGVALWLSLRNTYPKQRPAR